MAGRQGREELIKKGLLEMMEQGKWDGLHGGQGAGRGVAREHSPGCLSWAQEARQDGMEIGGVRGLHVEAGPAWGLHAWRSS